MSYQFSTKCKSLTPDKIWSFIQDGLSTDVTIRSIKEKIPYTVNYVNDSAISFTASTRNEGEAEVIEKTDFEQVVGALLNESEFNTSTSKLLFKGTKIYKKRSPLFALLLSSGVIEKIYVKT